MSDGEQSLFRSVLGAAFDSLPYAIRELHDERPFKSYEGEVEVRRGTGIVAGIIGDFFGLPRQGSAKAVKMTIVKEGDREVWIRDIEGRRFRSVISRCPLNKANRIVERIGIFSFDIDLDARLGRLYYPVSRCRIGFVPFPMAMTMRRDIVEHLTGPDLFYFSMKIDLPFFGNLIIYEGWLDDRHSICMTTLASSETVE